MVTSKDIFGQFGKSLALCFKSVGYALLISLIFCYLSVLPIFRPVCEFVRKFRFLPSTGLSFLFMRLAPDVNHMMSWMMIFGITTYLVDACVGVALSVTRDQILYCRSLRMNRWETVRETLIFGKASEIFDCVIQNFALAWMLLAAVENIFKASGGIGVLLADGNKYFKFGEVYAIQILILMTGMGLDWMLRQVKSVLFPYAALKTAA